MTITPEDEAHEFDIELGGADLIEANYNDLIASWVDKNDQQNTNKLLEKSEYYDLLKRDQSVSKIFNHGSSDSLMIENDMIMKMKPQIQMYKEQMMGTSID